MKRFVLFCAALLALTAAAPAQEVGIDIRPSDIRTPIAVPPFIASPGLEGVARELAEVLVYDLEFNGLFRVLPPASYPQGFVSLPGDVSQLNLEQWASTPAEYLVYATVTGDGAQVSAQFRLFDVLAKNQVTGLELRTSRDNPRLVAHKFSEEVIRYLDGVPGIGTTTVVFSGGATGKKEIFIADYDGANRRQITQHGSISINPVLSPDGSKVAYMSFKDRYGFLYIYDTATGASRQFSREVGLNAAATWSPDGRRIAYVLSKDGNTEIYVKNVDGSGLLRLTNNRFGDTSPSFSPDGRRICFVSDRGGAAQIFVMGADGSNQQRVSTQGGSSYDPEWSPDGKSIAYVVEQRGDGMEIWMMDAGGTNARRLTNSQGNNENPSWSPDSRHVVFSSTRAGRPQLWTVNVLTGEERMIPNSDIAGQGPSWGPRRG